MFPPRHAHAHILWTFPFTILLVTPQKGFHPVDSVVIIIANTKSNRFEKAEMEGGEKKGTKPHVNAQDKKREEK